jgi:hypothetical protein
MVIVWKLPVAVETAVTDAGDSVASDAVLAAHQIAAMSNFQVINEKPLFNESRLPELEEEVVDEEPAADLAITVTDAPDVRLTGVIITPSMKIASLTPADGELEAVMAYEGQPLTGEFVGWQVSDVKPRAVVLESREGQRLTLDLQVHDLKIQEPPKPAAPAKAAQADPGQGEEALGEDGEPLSRAEQIRQRIAERREELRLEQEQQQAQSGAQAAKPQNEYQNAIRAMMRNNSKDKSSNDKKNE